jgi:hypothetical protein
VYSAAGRSGEYIVVIRGSQNEHVQLWFKIKGLSISLHDGSPGPFYAKFV